MKTSELDRAKVIERVIERRLTAVDAAQQLGLTSRHVGGFVKMYRENGTHGLLSKQRGTRHCGTQRDATPLAHRSWYPFK